MPNNSSARRDKRQGEKKGEEGQDRSQTFAQAGGGRQRGFLSLSLSPAKLEKVRAYEETSRDSGKTAKEVALFLSSAGTDKGGAVRSSSVKAKDNSRSLYVRLSTDAQPKGGSSKRRISLLSDTDEGGSDNTSDSSKERGAERLLELERQRSSQVSPPSSPKQNEFLTGLMKRLERQQAKAATKQTLDKDPLSLSPFLVQAQYNAGTEEVQPRTGDVTGLLAMAACLYIMDPLISVYSTAQSYTTIIGRQLG
jgi:hypothetical protein